MSTQIPDADRDAQPETNDATLDEIEEQIEKQNAKIETQNAKIENLISGVQSAWDEIEELQSDLEEERHERQRVEEENKELKSEIEQLDARTDLLRLVESSDEMSGKQRSVALIQNLRREAERKRDRGKEATASVTRKEAERALQHPDVDRTTIYDDMKRAVRLVGDKNVLAYDSKTGGGSRLTLDLEAGEIPTSVGTPQQTGGGG